MTLFPESYFKKKKKLQKKSYSINEMRENKCQKYSIVLEFRQLNAAVELNFSHISTMNCYA